MTLERVTKSSRPSGDAKRAVPAVGSTWLGPEDFVKRSSVIEYSPRGLAAALPHLRTLAGVEGLTGHGRAAELRLGNDGGTSA